MAEPLTRITASQAVVNHFRELIRRGQLRAGDKLPSERVLQEQLGLSRFSLREGLARLSALGLVRIVHGKGAFVTDELNRASLATVFLPLFSGNDKSVYGDLYEARLLLEREAARLAATKAVKANHARLESLVARMRGALDDGEEFGELDRRFHRELIKAAGNVFFEKMYDVLDAHMAVFLMHHAKSLESRRKAQKQHESIFASIAASDSHSAGERVQQHIVGCRKNYERAMSKVTQHRKARIV